MLSKKPLYVFIFLSLFIIFVPTSICLAKQLPIIDAHSQVDHQVSLKRVVQVLNSAGISRVILSPRGKLKEKNFLTFAKGQPDRITPSIRTKGNKYEKNEQKYYEQLKRRLTNPAYQAMAELIIWHSAKGNRAGKRVVLPDAPQVHAALEGALDKRWPFVMHIEFKDAREDKEMLMTKLKSLLFSYPDHSFALIHMGQLSPEEVQRLIETHPNIYFITSKASPFFTKKQPQWINMFSGNKLTATWKHLLTAYPKRFILALDAVWAEDWGSRYVEEVALWREALKELPDVVAHAVAHKNAERLWQLPLAEFPVSNDKH